MAWKVEAPLPDGQYEGAVVDVRVVDTKYGRQVVVDLETEDGRIAPMWFRADFSVTGRFVSWARGVAGRPYEQGEVIAEEDLIGKRVVWRVENGKVVDAKPSNGDVEPRARRGVSAAAPLPSTPSARGHLDRLRDRLLARAQRLGLSDDLKLWWKNDRPSDMSPREVMESLLEMSDEEFKATVGVWPGDDSDPFLEVNGDEDAGL